MSSITYSERIKIETFCELGLSNIQMGAGRNCNLPKSNETKNDPVADATRVVCS
nr:hypothetical protein [Oenococcus oeni]